MRKYVALAAGLAGLAVAASPAQAATFVVTVTDPSTTYGNNNVTCADLSSSCSFTDTFTFDPSGYELVSATITSVATSDANDIDFTSVMLNGVSFNLLTGGLLNPSSSVEFGTLLNQALVAGTNTLTVEGQGRGAYSGVLSFSFRNQNAVPEPGTWAMMLMGFGATGFALRRRRSNELTQIA